jgi:DNA-binding LytR/AlgR family response regulator
MGKYKYIIIDDDLPSHLAVSHHFKNYPKYKCAKVFYNPVEALNYLHKNKIDLIFLDIEMSEMNGFQFLEALQQNIFVVILTAYPDKYSLDAHKFYHENLIYYSNKAQLLYYFPKIIARFEKLFSENEIINRINQLFKNEINTFPYKINNETISLTNIRIIEVVGHNLVLKMNNKEEHIYRMAFSTLKNFLPANLFFRIRRNIIINIMYVTAFSDVTICLDKDHFIVSLKFNKNIITELKAALQVMEK